MNMKQKFSLAINNQTNILMISVSLLTVFGTMIVLSGGVWDAISHILNEPEFFWTIQHIVVYAGVAMSTLATLIAYVVFRTTSLQKFSLGVKILFAGTILQIVSGFGDSISHDIFGIDGLVSFSHQPLELGLVLVTLSSFFILKNIQNKHTQKLIPFSIMSFIIATSWLGFNLVLIIGGTLMCLPIYEMFSSGCAIL